MKPPKIILIIGWILLIGMTGKLAMTPFSWSHFELWRSIVLTLLKCTGLASAIFLIRGTKLGAYLYWVTTVLTTSIFYLYPPPLEGIERYFSPVAISLALLIPIVVTVILIRSWSKLK